MITAIVRAAAIGSEGHAPPIKPALLYREARRVQRPRKRLQGPESRPAQAYYVGRGSLFANPFLGRRFGHARSIRLHREWLRGELSERRLIALGYSYSEIAALARLRWRVFANLHRLIGRDIQCWCPVTSRWCHGDTLKELAAELAREIAAQERR